MSISFKKVLLSLIFITTTFAQEAKKPTPQEQNIIQKINQSRLAKKIMPCSLDNELNTLATKELSAMLENPQLASTLKNRLKANPRLTIGHSSLLFASPNDKTLIADLIKQKSYPLFINQEIEAVGLSIIKVDSEPPFYQILIIGAKAQPLDPCNGQPGLSDSQVEKAKQAINEQIIKCYNSQLEFGDPNLRGVVNYSLVVKADGTVKRNLLFASEELQKNVYPCIDNIMAKLLKFPKPCGTKDVNIRRFGWDFVPPQGDKRIGRLSPNEIKQAIQQHRPIFRKCYEKELKKDKQLNGEISLKFQINNKGKIINVTISKDSINNQNMNSCILDQAKRIIFPAPKYNGEVEFEFPLTFTPDKQK